MVTIARASSPWGPFEPCPRNPILTHREPARASRSRRRATPTWSTTGKGNWWMVLLGIRPQGGYYWHHLGRETFLAPVRWDAQGWPVVNDGKPIALDMRVRGCRRAPRPRRARARRLRRARSARLELPAQSGARQLFDDGAARVARRCTGRRCRWSRKRASRPRSSAGASSTCARASPCASTSRRRATKKRRGWCCTGRRAIATRSACAERRRPRGVRAADRRRAHLGGDRVRAGARARTRWSCRSTPRRRATRSRGARPPSACRSSTPPSRASCRRRSRAASSARTWACTRWRRAASATPAAFDWFDYERRE